MTPLPCPTYFLSLFRQRLGRCSPKAMRRSKRIVEVSGDFLFYVDSFVFKFTFAFVSNTLLYRLELVTGFKKNQMSFPCAGRSMRFCCAFAILQPQSRSSRPSSPQKVIIFRALLQAQAKQKAKQSNPDQLGT